MCKDCGCGDPDVVPVEVQERILSANDEQARHNREHFEESQVFAVNLMGSPGSGKTAVLEATARALAGRLRLGAVSGDLATDNDAQRLQKAGIPSACITTGQSCHLDARLVHHALHGFRERGEGPFDVFVIENVGNLVCPAIYDLGEAGRVVALSVTEGEDKPLKYPVMFQHADLVLLTKVDLLPHLDLDLGKLQDALARVMPVPRVLQISARTGQGIEAWIEWLSTRHARQTQAHAGGHSHAHAHADGHSHAHPGSHAHAGAHSHADAHAHSHAHSHD